MCTITLPHSIHPKPSLHRGDNSYLSVEMGNRDFVSGIWNAIEKGIRLSRSEIRDKLKEDGIDLPLYTDDEVENFAR